MIYQKKIWILTWGIFNNTEHAVETIYGEFIRTVLTLLSPKGSPLEELYRLS